MAHVQKPDFVFRRNGRVHLNRRGRQFSRLLAAELCASAVVILDTPCSEVVWRVLATHFIHQFPLHFPSRASLCAITFQLDSTSRCPFWTFYFFAYFLKTSARGSCPRSLFLSHIISLFSQWQSCHSQNISYQALKPIYMHYWELNEALSIGSRNISGHLTFTGPCILIYSYSTTNKMHL